MKVIEQTADYLYSVGMISDMEMLKLIEKGFYPKPTKEEAEHQEIEELDRNEYQHGDPPKPDCPCPSCLHRWVLERRKVRKARKEKLKKIPPGKPKYTWGVTEIDETEEMLQPLLTKDCNLRFTADYYRYERRYKRKKHQFSSQRKKRIAKLRHKRKGAELCQPN